MARAKKGVEPSGEGWFLLGFVISFCHLPYIDHGIIVFSNPWKTIKCFRLSTFEWIIKINMSHCIENKEGKKKKIIIIILVKWVRAISWQDAFDLFYNIEFYLHFLKINLN